MAKSKALQILAKIAALHKELHEHQEKCEHPDVTTKYGSNTGNYDPTCDCYWTDYKCNVCLKFWTIYK